MCFVGFERSLSLVDLPRTCCWHLGWLKREGALSITIKAVEAADQGDDLADAALRTVGAELQTLLVQGRDLAPGHLQIVAYLQRAARRAPHKRKRGRQLRRSIAPRICCLQTQIVRGDQVV
jgi:hypothetical protein